MSVLLLASASIAWAKADLVSAIYSSETYLWQRPGMTLKDCPAGAPQAPCDYRLNLLSPGEEVKVVTGLDGKPVSASKELMVENQLQRKNFIFVEIFKDGEVVRGWVPEGSISSPHELERPPQICYREAQGTNSAKSVQTQISSLRSLFEDKMPLPEMKTPAQIDHFMCLYNEAKWDGDIFKKEIQKFKAAATDAAAAFGLPYGLVMCTMLIESGLNHRPHETKKYRGYGQFGPELIKDLSAVSEQAPYREMWSQFQSKHPQTQLTDKSIRDSADPTASAAAVALALRWIYQERLPAAKCRDCSTNLNLNRKDLYMMVTGYDYGPYTIDKLAKRSPSSLHTGQPPPAETRHYMTQMLRCLSANYTSNFREKSQLPNLPKLERSCP